MNKIIGVSAPDHKPSEPTKPPECHFSDTQLQSSISGTPYAFNL